MSVALWHPCRSPRVLRTHLHAYACRIYSASFCASIGLCRNSPAHPNASPHIRFLFVRPALCLGLPSDSQSPTTPLPSANTSPCRVCRGLSPPSKCALPGARVENRLFACPPSSNRACAINAHSFPMFFTPGHAHLHDLRLLARLRMSNLCSIIERVTAGVACLALV